MCESVHELGSSGASTGAGQTPGCEFLNPWLPAKNSPSAEGKGDKMMG